MFKVGDLVKVTPIDGQVANVYGPVVPGNWYQTFRVTNGPDSDGDVRIVGDDGTVNYVLPRYLTLVEPEQEWKPGDTAWLKPIDGAVFNSQMGGKANRWDFTEPVTIAGEMDEDGDLLIDNMSGTDSALVLLEHLSRTQVVFHEPEPEPQVEDRLTKGIREARLKLASLGEEKEALQETLAVLEKAQELLEK